MEAHKSAPVGLLAKMEAEMLSAHTARDTKRGKYKSAVQEAETSHAPVAPLLALPPVEAAASSNPDLKKRPTASKSVLKRPSAALEVLSHIEGVDMTDVFIKLRKEKGPISRGAFTSRAHDVAKTRAKRKVDIDAASAFARYNYKQASALYDEMGLRPPMKRKSA